MRRVLAFFFACWFALAPAFAGPPAGSAPPPVPAIDSPVFNFTSTSLKKWNTALSKVFQGTANAKLAVVGDSLARGYLSTGTPGTNSVNSWPAQLAQLLKLRGVPTTYQNVMGNGNLGSPYDSRLTLNNWTLYTTYPTAGGFAFYGTSGNSSGTLQFAPPEPVDTCDVYYIQAAAAYSANINFDGGTNTNISASNASSVPAKATVATTLGTHTLNISYVNGFVYIQGVECYNSTNKSVLLSNFGWTSSRATQWAKTDTNFSPVNQIKFYAPNLTLIVLGGGNDMIDFPADPSAYVTAMQALITAAKISGDVILATTEPLPTATYGTTAQQQAYAQATYQLAATNNVPLVDINKFFGGPDNTALLSLGITNADNIHLLAVGAGVEAPLYLNLLVGNAP